MDSIAKITIDQSPYHTCLLWVTPTMQQIANEINNLYPNKYTFSVGLVPAGYYVTEKERSWYTGYKKYSSSEIDDRKNYDENLETLCIIKCVPSNASTEKIKEMVKELYVTSGGGNYKHDIFEFKYNNDRYDTYIRTYYLCKKEGFDEIFNVMEKYIPSLTLQKLIELPIGKMDDNRFANNDYNTDLVYLTHYTPENPVDILETYENIIEKEYCPVIWYTINISIIATDLEKNHDKLFEIIEVLSDINY